MPAKHMYQIRKGQKSSPAAANKKPTESIGTKIGKTAAVVATNVNHVAKSNASLKSYLYKIETSDPNLSVKNEKYCLDKMSAKLKEKNIKPESIQSFYIDINGYGRVTLRNGTVIYSN